jgi:polyhydroxyalkanoate synthesis regulator protein
LDEL